MRRQSAASFFFCFVCRVSLGFHNVYFHCYKPPVCFFFALLLATFKSSALMKIKFEHVACQSGSLAGRFFITSDAFACSSSSSEAKKGKTGSKRLSCKQAQGKMLLRRETHNLTLKRVN